MKNNHVWRILGIVIVIIAIWVSGAWLRFLYTPIITDNNGIRYYLRPRTTSSSLATDLTQKHIISQPIFFKILMRIRHDHRTLKAGQYLFPKGATPSNILEQMVTGNGMIYYAFTIVEGWNFKQLTAALLQENNLQHTIQNLSDAELMKQIGYPIISPEGEFFPDTYFFTGGSTDISLLKRAHRALQDKLSNAWQNRDVGLPFLNAYEALIAASLIEKEAHLSQERPMIAGVLVNRLQKHMLLQFDPTVIYGLGARYDGKIYKQDLVTNTPYNTYIHKGLPPTPIAMPSLNSIRAVLHPQKNNYLYFVANGEGSHRFSETLAEHHLAVSAPKITQPEFFFNVALVQHYLAKIITER